MMVGRVLPRVQTIASAMESMNKGATVPEGATETTIGTGENRDKSSEPHVSHMPFLGNYCWSNEMGSA